jgi:hypothetical protein
MPRRKQNIKPRNLPKQKTNITQTTMTSQWATLYPTTKPAASNITHRVPNSAQKLQKRDIKNTKAIFDSEIILSSNEETTITDGCTPQDCTLSENTNQTSSKFSHNFDRQKHNITIPTKDGKRFMQIPLQPPMMTNEPYGDDIDSISDDDEIILFHNINGMKDHTNWYQIITTMQELNISIFGFTEINRSLTRGYSNEWRNIIRKVFYYSRSVHSESNIHLESNYKPGGTMTTVTGKWLSRISLQEHDPKGLGRWSFVKISSKKSSMVIITAYRPCATQGPQTAWMQQWVLLRESGAKNPDPIQTFYHDLESQLQEWREQGIEILLLIDANEHIGEKPGGLTSIIGKLEMADLVRHRHPSDTEPNTHIRGS